MKKEKLHRCNRIWKVLCAAVLLALVTMFISSVWKLRQVYAAGEDIGYIRIEQTENEEVIRYTEIIGEAYGICPELLQALIFYESGNQKTVVSKGGDIGYMQVNPKWHRDRMDRLGVTDLTDGYENILVGADLLAELAEKYGDIPYVLMKYNGDSRADSYAAAGKMSGYAEKILNLSTRLEKYHEK